MVDSTGNTLYSARVAGENRQRSNMRYPTLLFGLKWTTTERFLKQNLPNR